MLSKAYFLAKFRFDTAENEPAKIYKILLIFPILLTLTPHPSSPSPRGRGVQHRDAAGAGAGRRVRAGAAEPRGESAPTGGGGDDDHHRRVGVAAPMRWVVCTKLNCWLSFAAHPIREYLRVPYWLFFKIYAFPP